MRNAKEGTRAMIPGSLLRGPHSPFAPILRRGANSLHSMSTGEHPAKLSMPRLRAFFSFLRGNMYKGPFIAIHLALIAVFFVPVTWQALTLCGGLYLLRMFAITAGFHRYFSHRAYKTSRWFQFVLACL